MTTLLNVFRRRHPLRPGPARVCALAVAALAGMVTLVGGAAPAPMAASSPSLLVVLVVDQFRADYVDRFQPQWSSGLTRLLTEGARFTRAEYPYAGTVTCPGHASISTGRLPSSHGLTLNTWWDRATEKPRTCTADAQARNIGYGSAVPGGDSLAGLQGTTLTDEMRAQLVPRPRTVALSLKARSAVTLGGRHPDVVAWFDDAGAWTTSTAFADAPVPELAAYIAQHPVQQEAGTAWVRLQPGAAYLFDSPVRHALTRPWLTPGFPHALGTSGSTPDATFYQQWQTSPRSDAYLGAMALEMARELRLGASGRTDVLAVSFSALDLIGHAYGPQSHEVQDALMQLDRTIGALLTGLDGLVGAGRYTLALTGDHGVAPVPEYAESQGLPAGRVTAARLRTIVDDTLGSAFGPGAYLSGYTHPEVYLAPGVADHLRARPDVLQTLRAALLQQPGVARIFTADELEAEHLPIDDRLRLFAAHSHYPGRSGDLTLAFAPYWLGEPAGTSHGTAYAYDTRVPLVLYGRGIAPGIHPQPASPLDIAPTLAHLVGVTLPRVDGRVLTEALAVTPGMMARAQAPPARRPRP